MKTSNLYTVVLSRTFSNNSILRNELLSYFPNTKFYEESSQISEKEIPYFANGAELMIVALENISENVLSRFDRLKVVSKFGVGIDNIDLEACNKFNIKVGWEPGVNKVAVAELTCGYMISLSRNIYTTSNQLKAGMWNKNGGKQLSECTIGIIGIGNIGKDLIRILTPFNSHIIVNDIISQDDFYKDNGVTEVTKQYLLEHSDIVTIHTPLNDEMRYFINRRTLSQMKKTAFLINTARGRIVDQVDLKWALNNYIIAGAAIDVYEDEPVADMELLSIHNLINTPHIGGNSNHAVLAMGRSAIKGLINNLS